MSLLALMLFMRRLSELLLERSLALKWFCPGLRDKILPFLVTLSLLAYDLTVFLMILFFLDYYGQSLWAFGHRLGDLVFDGYELEDPLQTLFQEFDVHILGTPDQE